MIGLGVSGGIAAYKACELARWLQLQGASVIAILTPAATEFVTPLTFQALTGNPVVRELWGDQAPRFQVPAAAAKKLRGRVEHVDVAEALDLLVIAPATADLMARLVHGSAPDALTAVALACRAPIVVCPAMDLEMWRKASTQSNVRSLRARGARIVGPESGALASGLAGPGRLAAIEAIGAAVIEAAASRASMAGVRVLVGAGRTEEPLDPVRMLTNRSSGRMGYAVAEAARDRGASVTLVSGPADLDPPHGVELVAVRRAAEMERAMTLEAARSDVIVMAAAVADYRPARVSARKIKRTSDRAVLELEPNADILAGLGAARRKGQVLVGFALETNDGIRHARTKLRVKRLDFVVLNAPEASLGRETNRVTLVDASRAEALAEMTKREVAERVLDRVIAIRGMKR
ncbi:MAG: bifunctional phosphopantothenoylcysteine decarboxylase/phosphopantothenate--cysteine ligase CoaBC [Candidatus Eisenbacteria bacterium]|uniref:Coenzyme A biosynthesis bifunctional protein CoaBC n=1 Tax=Eiseniibacteriota bacterium TaxID=2212470 RepID=A0A849SJV8_UNCEI|nr:bifunctional phosphopantothenoylcysteine decarboxylase/phosphopantothenate--cysteine ligase CoaBC [Candidatus Eisenbacteria bacterium]